MMLRWLYIRLLRLHPGRFRERFGEEMLAIFDEIPGARGKVFLFADAMVSLARQWLLRSPGRRPEAAGVVQSSVAGPLFWTLDDYRPRRSALLEGGLLSLALLAGVIFAIPYGGLRHPGFLIGVHHPSPHLFPLDRSSFLEGDLSTAVQFGPEPEDPWRAMAAVYFKLVRVLEALDADGDFIISQWEIATAPAALGKLDRDHDGKLSAEECGFSLGVPESELERESVRRARLQFMRLNPALAALDADHDGEISAAEMQNSAAALRALDRNHDGALSPNELMPDAALNQAALILSRLDSDHDGKLSAAERSAAEAAPLRDLLQTADRNHDGVLTVEELAQELRLREERRRQFESALGKAGFGSRRRGMQ